MFNGSVVYDMLLWFEIPSSAFSRGSMIGGPVKAYVEKGTSPWRSRSFRSAKRKLTRIHLNVATLLRLNNGIRYRKSRLSKLLELLCAHV
jgi:hypothetical protein